MIESLIDLGPFQWIGLLFGIIYIIYAVRENPVCWIFGIISCGAIAIEDFTQTKLYQDGVLQIIYIVLGFYGLYKWKFGTQKTTRFQVKSLSFYNGILATGIGVIVSFCFAYIVGQYTDASFPLVDALTTVFSVIATILLVYKYLENWLLWIIIDVVYVYLYFDTSAPLFSVLYVIFTAMAIIGYLQWRKKDVVTST